MSTPDERSLCLAVAQLATLSVELRVQLIELARRSSPSAVGKHAQRCAVLAGCSSIRDLLAVERGTRWLAVILRDDGEDAFAFAAAAVLAGAVSAKLPELRLASGEVVKDRPDSHAVTHNDVAKLLPKALPRIDSNGRNLIVEEIDFGRVIGESICVPTTPSDRILFAQRPKRLGLTRFVIGRSPVPCSSMMVVLRWEDAGFYQLRTAYIGQQAEPEPWDKYATDRSVAFWNTHALVWGVEETIPGTETTRCPW